MDVTRDNSQIKCTDLKKCGEIATLLSIGKSAFFLNCGFCEYTFLQLDNFIQHIYEDHKSEFSRLEIKQEEFDMAEALEDGDAAMQTLDATEGNEYNSELNTFERVEIEFDTIEPEIKEENDDEYEDFFEEHKTPGKSKALLKNTGSKQHSPKTKINKTDEAVQDDANTRRVSEDPDFSVDMDATKTDSDMDYEKEMESMFQCGLNESQGTSMDEEDDYREEDNSPISESISKRKVVNKKIPESNQTKAESYTMVKKEATIPPNHILNDVQLITLAKIYEQYSCLWDERNIEFRFKNRRDEALKLVHKDFNDETGINLSIYDFDFEIKRLRKICSIEKRIKITCTRNNTNYRPTWPYYREIEYLEVDVPPFECLICGKLLSALGKQKVHIASHDGSLPFKCQLCGHGFQLGTNLSVHLRRHVHDYTYKCDVCDKPCATTTELKIHMRSHTGEKPFICSICGYKTVTSSHLLVHTLRHQKRPRHQCKLCPKMFYETTSLYEHMSVHSNRRDEICDICNKGFANRKQLKQHQLIHNVEKKYSCKICEKRFAQFAGLSCHMKSHGVKL